MPKNDRSVLSANVVALPVERGWIVGGKEDFEDILKSDKRWIEKDLNHLGVTSVTAANGLVGGPVQVASHESGDDGIHAPQFFVHRLKAPKAASPECCRLHALFDSTRFSEDPKTARALALSHSLARGAVLDRT